MKLKAISSAVSILFITIFTIDCICQDKKYSQELSITQKVDSVLNLMTLDEKIGQLNQYNDDWIAAGPVNYRLLIK